MPGECFIGIATQSFILIDLLSIMSRMYSHFKAYSESLWDRCRYEDASASKYFLAVSMELYRKVLVL